ncbi:hypothetical protein [Thermocrispum sp.]|uniref:hypothetical protein n=1 Tax=Thermocrispum sp. TaxID=2060768 RepID=UPI00257E8185|nr:hypothetical protein [Thermocrispum sp.]
MTIAVSADGPNHVVTATTTDTVVGKMTPALSTPVSKVVSLPRRTGGRRMQRLHTVREVKTAVTFQLTRANSHKEKSGNVPGTKARQWPPKWFSGDEGDGSAIGAHAKELLGDDFGK